MQNNVLDYLDKTVTRFPTKIAFADDHECITFQELVNQGKAIGSFLSGQGLFRNPVIVFMDKHPKTIVAFLGVIYSGNFYVPLDGEMPSYRIKLIIEKLAPKAIICDENTRGILETLKYSGKVFNYLDMVQSEIDELSLSNIRKAVIDTDPLYVVFTSGSTGAPKGVVACHRSVIDYIESLSSVLGFDENTIFGMQVPLYLDACLKELYPTLKFGATTFLIPKKLFMFPVKLVEYLNEKKINTICWVVSALTMISAFGALDKAVPKFLHTIAFGSEVFPIKQFKAWRRAMPEARFYNLYGPTEATGMSCYFQVDRDFGEDEVIPIGKPFKNTAILLLDEKKIITSTEEVGEICIRGTSLSLGYYSDFDKTNEAFVQNPLNSCYPELIYRTGDLGKYNDRGELIFVSRKDYQIKHMGHRIELGEIEANVNLIDGIKMACCIYNYRQNKIVLYYVGDVKNKDIIVGLKKRLPRYMLPNYIEQVERIPLTLNGKINRKYFEDKFK